MVKTEFSYHRVRIVAEEDVNMPTELSKNSEFAEKLKDMVQGFTKFEFVMKDEVARKYALRIDTSDQKTKDFEELNTGGVMRYQGEKVTIVEPHGEVGRPVTATIRTTKGEEKKSDGIILQEDF